MAKKNKYYVVWRGRLTGIFESWEECQQQIDGFEGAQFKGYPTRELAEAAHKLNYWQAVKPEGGSRDVSNSSFLISHSIIVPSLSVDAACSGNPGVMEYRGVDTATGREIFRMGPFEHATNNIGEFLALVHGLALLKQYNKTMPIYSDSVNAIAWVRAKKCRTKLARTEKNIEVFNLIARAEHWLEDNHYTTKIIKWDTPNWGEIPADFGRK
ncbi:MAG: viroplasmin family protein [Paludibacteraceae bacterium]|nr:viroplasmin family protein [Paludibacteraceae bacterium]